MAGLQARPERVRQRDQQMVAGRTRQPRLPDGNRMTTSQAAAPVVIHAHRQQLHCPRCRRRRAQDELQAPHPPRLRPTPPPRCTAQPRPRHRLDPQHPKVRIDQPDRPRLPGQGRHRLTSEKPPDVLLKRTARVIARREIDHRRSLQLPSRRSSPPAQAHQTPAPPAPQMDPVPPGGQQPSKSRSPVGVLTREVPEGGRQGATALQPSTPPRSGNHWKISLTAPPLAAATGA